MADLLIRETILGVLKARDEKRTYKIHSSDFRKALNDLEIPWGTPVIEDVMVHCRVDSSGFIDFSALEAQLETERREYNEKVSSEKKRVPSSVAAPVTPWRADTAQKDKIKKENQSRLVTQNREIIMELYKAYSDHRMSFEDMIVKLQLLGLEVSRTFTTYISQNQHTHIPFSTFLNKLSAHDERSIEEGLAKSAGVSRSELERREGLTTDSSLFQQRKRSIWLKNSETEGSTKPLANIGDYLGINATSLTSDSTLSSTNLRVHAVNSDSLRSSTHLKDTLFPEANDPTAFLFSSNSEKQMSGLDANTLRDIHVSSELKMAREQTLVALRKVGEQQMSVAEFQSRLFDLGYDLSEPILSELRKVENSGRLDMKRMVSILDNELFKVSVIRKSQQLSAELEDLKSAFIKSLFKNAENGFLSLELKFREMDENHSNSLSYLEFSKACRNIGLPPSSYSDDDIRSLFNAFDRNGDGELQFSEFIDIMRKPVNNNRRQFIKYVFMKCDTRGKHLLNISEIVSNCNFDAFKSLFPNNYTADHILQEMTDYFVSYPENINGKELAIGWESFFNYLANLSTRFENDDTFVNALKSSFGLSDKVPAAVNDASLTDRGASTHGDIIRWNQEVSEMEKESQVIDMKGKKIVSLSNHQSNITTMQWDTKNASNKGFDASAQEQDLRCDGLGGRRTSADNCKNLSHTNLLHWKEQRSPKKPSASAVSIPEKKALFDLISDKDLYGNSLPKAAGEKSGFYQLKCEDELHLETKARRKFDLEISIHHQPKPYGVDVTENSAKPNANANNGKPKSLSDALKEVTISKQSLASYTGPNSPVKTNNESATPNKQKPKSLAAFV